jgi:glycosyltransferase involved in cell wall biosynthesis
MPPLHVLWLIDHVTWDGSLHGGGRLFQHLPAAFDSERVKIFPYVLRAEAAARRVLAAAPVPVTTLRRRKYDPSTALLLHRLCRRHGIQVMHLFCYASSTIGRIVGALTRTPTVIHDFDRQAFSPYPRWLSGLDRLLAPVTSRALATSPFCRTYLRDQRQVPEDRIDLLPYAIPSSRFAAAAHMPRNAARAQLGWTPNLTVFTAVTKLGPGRGVDLLLRAFVRVAELRPATRLVIVYPGDDSDSVRYREGLGTLALHLGLGEQVEWVSSLTDVDVYYAATDAIVAPHTDERCSSVRVMEGFAHGRPAVATDLGEQHELLADGRHALLVPPGDRVALIAALIQMADDKVGRDAMGQAAAALARRYSVDACARRLTDLYERLVREPVSSRRLAPAAR